MALPALVVFQILIFQLLSVCLSPAFAAALKNNNCDFVLHYDNDLSIHLLKNGREAATKLKSSLKRTYHIPCRCPKGCVPIPILQESGKGGQKMNRKTGEERAR